MSIIELNSQDVDSVIAEGSLMNFLMVLSLVSFLKFKAFPKVSNECVSTSSSSKSNHKGFSYSEISLAGG